MDIISINGELGRIATTGSNQDLTLSGHGTGAVGVDSALVGTPETVSGDGSGTDAVSVDTLITILDTSGGTSALTLAAGSAGQIKYIIMGTAGNAATMTTANGNLAGTVSTSIVWDAIGEAVTLIYTGNKWGIAGHHGVTIS